jgi:hypothetical protein
VVTLRGPVASAEEKQKRRFRESNGLASVAVIC